MGVNLLYCRFFVCYLFYLIFIPAYIYLTSQYSVIPFVFSINNATIMHFIELFAEFKTCLNCGKFCRLMFLY